jgi:hypothetical protein
MTNLKNLGIAAMLTTGLFVTDGARADTLYALDSGKTLMTLDTGTGVATIIGVGNYIDTIGNYGVGLAFNPNTGVMSSRSFDNLYTVDLGDGSLSLVGPSTPFITGLTFDDAYTTLYSVSQSTGPFFTVDPLTGTATVVGNMGILTPLGLTTRSDGAIFTATIGGEVYIVDPNTAQATLVGSNFGIGFTEIAFDSNDVLYAVTLETDMLGTIDLDAGTFNPIGPVGFTDIRGLAFAGEAGCFADCDGNGVLNILDFVCYQGLFQNGDPGADCDGNGVLNILDFVCFQGAFLNGCN